MRTHQLRRLVTLLVTVVVASLGLVALGACKPTCTSMAMPNDGKDGQGFGPLAKPGNGSNAKGGGSKAKSDRAKPKPCAGGSKTNAKKDSKKRNMKLFGANGAKLSWSKPVANGSAGGRAWRIDLENPEPGYRDGSLHVQLDNRLGGTRWEYAGEGKFKTEDGTKLPNAVQKDIDRRAEDDIRNALKRYLKEPW
jgi:hypothetical protein